MELVLRAARIAPRPVADAVLRVAAGRLARGTSALVESCRLNQYVVSGMTLAGEALDRAVRENILMMGRFPYELYNALGRPEREDALVVLDERAERFLRAEREDGPFVVAAIHYGNFDLIARVLSRNGWYPQVLSVPDPSGGYQWQNELRRGVDIEVTPISVDSLKQAARGLAAGRSVVTGLDWPMPEPDKIEPRFFGHEAPLPLLHVRMAMKAQVPVVLLCAPRMPDGRYHLYASDPIVMEGDRITPETLRLNAERCTAIAEDVIRRDPSQWAMSHIVWPSLAGGRVDGASRAGGERTDADDAVREPGAGVARADDGPDDDGDARQENLT